ncbi:hypothetical protein [Treponema pedis]|uniref:Uncharacterized protein n=1 Tax=Treponema pedis str. T A4 TaxID=1291379 RepID=S6A990_9SPIR|nr:hypothetical protein [Treponema pedis]AGT45159.1 hypothetical protein TPE_2687 [Treponema pedis str. T A4]
MRLTKKNIGMEAGGAGRIGTQGRTDKYRFMYRCAAFPISNDAHFLITIIPSNGSLQFSIIENSS